MCVIFVQFLTDPAVRWHFVTGLVLYGKELLAHRPTPDLDDRLLSTVRDCLFNIFAATLHIWRPSAPPAT
jgi:hypothetical protein